MKLRIIPVGQLKQFVTDDAFKSLPQVPITPLRASSQQANPNAGPDDPALIIAYNTSDEVIAYFGCLPDTLQKAPATKVCWSSCWWADPVKGKTAVMPVFYKALQLWEGRMLFDALPERSRAILERMGRFSFREIEGIQGYQRFKWRKAVPSRFSFLAPLKSLFYALDALFNIPMDGWLALQKTRWKTPEDTRVVNIDHIDEEAASFIKKEAGQDLMQCNDQTFNWIIDHPWLSADKAFTERYYFSSHAYRFEHRLFKIYQRNELVALLWLTFRDGTVKLPYCYVRPGQEDRAVQVLVDQLLRLPAEVFICFQGNIMECLKQKKLPFFYQKPIRKVFGWTPALDDFFIDTPYIQDGDGDGVFT